ncbi:unnamed protein product [Blepharisma stoltei]|uniref:RING-type domain-containing protein n=1 Tax=Blepharisma stoltei TaxID=1481888 RepID=A0AAU9IJG0_9CILI|nr:unnamed protein product [Blepharisma stoltei]
MNTFHKRILNLYKCYDFILNKNYRKEILIIMHKKNLKGKPKNKKKVDGMDAEPDPSPSLEASQAFNNRNQNNPHQNYAPGQMNQLNSQEQYYNQPQMGGPYSPPQYQNPSNFNAAQFNPPPFQNPGYPNSNFNIPPPFPSSSKFPNIPPPSNPQPFASMPKFSQVRQIIPNIQPPQNILPDEDEDLPDISLGTSLHNLPLYKSSPFPMQAGKVLQQNEEPMDEDEDSDSKTEENVQVNFNQKQASLPRNNPIAKEENKMYQTQILNDSRSFERRSIPKLLQFPQITPVKSNGISKRTDISLLKPYVKNEADFEYLQLSFSQVRGIGSIFNMNTALSVAYYDYLMIPALKAENNKISYEISLGKDTFQTYQNQQYELIMNSMRNLLSRNMEEVSKLWENDEHIQILRGWISIVNQNYLRSAEAKGLFDQNLGDEIIAETTKDIIDAIFEGNSPPDDFLFKIFANSLKTKIKVFKSTDQGIVKEAYEPMKENSFPVLNFFMMTNPEIRLYILYSKKMVFLDGYDINSGTYKSRKIENPQRYLFFYKKQIDDNSKIKEEELKTYESALKLESQIIQSYDRNIFSLYNKLRDSNVKLNPKETMAGVNKIKDQIDFIKNNLKPEFIEKLGLNNLEFIRLTDEVIHEIVKTCCYCNKQQGIWKSPCDHYYCPNCIFNLIATNKFEFFICSECEETIIELKDLAGFSEFSQLKDQYLNAHNKFECRSCNKELELADATPCNNCKKCICTYCLSKYVVSNRREIQNFQVEIQCNICEAKMTIGGLTDWMEKCEACEQNRHILDFYEFECRPGENPHGLLCRMCWALCYNDVCAKCGTPVSYNANMAIANENKIYCPLCREQNKLVFLGEKMCMSGNCFPCNDCQEAMFDQNPGCCAICGDMMADKISELGYNLWNRIN